MPSARGGLTLGDDRPKDDGPPTRPGGGPRPSPSAFDRAAKWIIRGVAATVLGLSVTWSVAYLFCDTFDPLDRCSNSDGPPAFTLVANPSIVTRGESSTVSAIVGGNDQSPCSPSTIFWERDVGKLQLQVVTPEGDLEWLDMPGGPTSALVVRWVAPKDALATGHIKATLVDCAQLRWNAQVVIPVVVGSPPQ